MIVETDKSANANNQGRNIELVTQDNEQASNRGTECAPATWKSKVHTLYYNLKNEK